MLRHPANELDGSNGGCWSVDLQELRKLAKKIAVPLVGAWRTLGLRPFEKLIEELEQGDVTVGIVVAVVEHQLVKASVCAFAAWAEIEATAVDRDEPGVTVLTEPGFGIAGHSEPSSQVLSESPERAEKFAMPSGSCSYLGALILYRILYQRNFGECRLEVRKFVSLGSD
jgi:hypothetical protein